MRCSAGSLADSRVKMNEFRVPTQASKNNRASLAKMKKKIFKEIAKKQILLDI